MTPLLTIPKVIIEGILYLKKRLFGHIHVIYTVVPTSEENTWETLSDTQNYGPLFAGWLKKITKEPESENIYNVVTKYKLSEGRVSIQINQDFKSVTVKTLSEQDATTIKFIVTGGVENESVILCVMSRRKGLGALRWFAHTILLNSDVGVLGKKIGLKFGDS